MKEYVRETLIEIIESGDGMLEKWIRSEVRNMMYAEKEKKREKKKKKEDKEKDDSPPQTPPRPSIQAAIFAHLGNTDYEDKFRTPSPPRMMDTGCSNCPNWGNCVKSVDKLAREELKYEMMDYDNCMGIVKRFVSENDIDQFAQERLYSVNLRDAMQAISIPWRTKDNRNRSAVVMSRLRV
jgi:glutaredoxin-related protein